ncbi:MAG: hypothetical protein IT383_16740, partial [Deltaproteobacteria bacterium]|nr:hypothetical protein [Deltaproteobacteria bacterium]
MSLGVSAGVVLGAMVLMSSELAASKGGDRNHQRDDQGDEQHDTELVLAAATALTGSYSSPLGQLSLVEKDGTVTARIADAKNNRCGLAKGTVVLEGSRLDDSVVGTFTACKVGDGCSGPASGSAMLLVT